MLEQVMLGIIIILSIGGCIMLVILWEEVYRKRKKDRQDEQNKLGTTD